MQIWGKRQSKNLTIYKFYILENLLKIYILEVSKFQKISSHQLIFLCKGELQLEGKTKFFLHLISLQNWQELNTQISSMSYTTDRGQVTKILLEFSHLLQSFLQDISIYKSQSNKD